MNEKEAAIAVIFASGFAAGVVVCAIKSAHKTQKLKTITKMQDITIRVKNLQINTLEKAVLDFAECLDDPTKSETLADRLQERLDFFRTVAPEL